MDFARGFLVLVMLVVFGIYAHSCVDCISSGGVPVRGIFGIVCIK